MFGAELSDDTDNVRRLRGYVRGLWGNVRGLRGRVRRGMLGDYGANVRRRNGGMTEEQLSPSDGGDGAARIGLFGYRGCGKRVWRWVG